MTPCSVGIVLDPFTLCLRPASLLLAVHCGQCGYDERTAMCAECYVVIYGMLCSACHYPYLTISEPVAL